MDVSELIYRLGIVPVIKIEDEKDARPLAEALIQGGLPIAEVTFRTDKGKNAIKIMLDQFPEMIVGAGTVLNVKHVDEAIEAGAKFIVTPGINPEIVEYCIQKNMPIFPGCSTASELEIALSYGLDVVKFFPAGAAGGLPIIKALSEPYQQMRFMPTGGVNLNNLEEYLAFENVIACGGTWMVKENLIKEKKFDEIRQTSSKAVKKMLGFSIEHISINSSGNGGAIVKQYAELFNLEIRQENTTYFTNQSDEIREVDCFGENGRIVISTNNIIRAIFHLEQKGFQFNKQNAKYDMNENLKEIYLSKEIGGFLVHLVQK